MCLTDYGTIRPRLSHKTAPIDVRERLAVPERELPAALEALGEVSELAERMVLHDL